MDVSDWRAVSQHYVREVVAKAVPKLATSFKPTLLVAASDDGLAVARVLRDSLREAAAIAPGPPRILTPTLEVLDESNPYHQHVLPYTDTLAGQHILVVDKADNSRATLAKFVAELQAKVDAEGPGTAAAATASAPQTLIGVFVLHNKRKPKAADLPAEVLEGRYFCGEESDNLCIAYPFNTGPDTQPVQHGEHASGAQPPIARKSSEHHHRPTTPPPLTPSGAPRDTLRTLSSHYVETILETAVEQQRLVERFAPTMLVAASDGALPAARLLRHYLRFRAHAHPKPATTTATTSATSATAAARDLPLLTPRLELFDEDTNPYLAHISDVKEWGAASLAGQHVLVVDKADDTRVSLAAFLNGLQAAAAEAVAADGGRDGPVFGVFVLHRKKVAKAADLPADILADRYFYCEEAEDVRLGYPFAINGA